MSSHQTTPDTAQATFAATVVITTKNRHDELARALASALAQGRDVEVLVIDDGSSDGTSEMVRDRFPAARVVRNEESRGYIESRNLGARLARAPILFSIDDDAVFSTPLVVRQTLAEFDDRRIAVVAIPYTDVLVSPQERQRTPRAGVAYAAADFRGTAHALRRDAFLSLGGYRPVLRHMAEEEDLCVRLYDAGYFVKLGNSDPILHHESPNRDRRRIRYFITRNNILFAFHNAPLAALVPNVASTSCRFLIAGVRDRTFGAVIRGLAAGLARGLTRWPHRRPIRWSAFWLYRRLRSGGPRPVSEIEAQLNALAAGGSSPLRPDPAAGAALPSGGPTVPARR